MDRNRLSKNAPGMPTGSNSSASPSRSTAGANGDMRHLPPATNSATSSPASTRGVRRTATEAGSSSSARKKAKTSDRGKGLRHFSLKVCQKVQSKGVTSYNEVADELVAEHQEAVAQGLEESDGSINEPKNIRRRVYDALNVLMAMNIISKEKKQIKWIGLPNNSAQEYAQYEQLKQKRLEEVQRRKAHMFDLIIQQIAFKNLIKRNEARMKDSDVRTAPQDSIHLPFIIVNTAEQATIDCQMAEDKSEYMFEFDSPFEIHDDVDILKKMGLAFGLDDGTCTPADLEKAKQMVPRAMVKYVEELYETNRKRRLEQLAAGKQSTTGSTQASSATNGATSAASASASASASNRPAKPRAVRASAPSSSSPTK